MRQKAFHADLTDADRAAAHVIPSAGFTDGVPQHRTYWTIATGFRGTTRLDPPSGDILVTDGKAFYEVQGFPVHRHSYFDPRLKGYKLLAGTVGAGGAVEIGPAKAGKKAQGGRGPATPRRKPTEEWSSDIPLTGKAMVLAGDVLFAAGPVDRLRRQPGGKLWALAASDGKLLKEYALDAPPAAEGLAAAAGRLYLATRDGRVLCFGKGQ